MHSGQTARQGDSRPPQKIERNTRSGGNNMTRPWQTRGSSRRPVASILVSLLAALLAPGTASAFDGCSASLLDASGVLGTHHKHVFKGTCTKLLSSPAKKTIGGLQVGSGGTYKYLNVEFVGEGEWNRVTQMAEEQMKFTGGVQMTRLVTARCTNDPFLANPPDGASVCSAYKVSVDVTAGPVYDFYDEHRFYLAKQSNLAVAQALSSETTSKPPAKPASGTTSPQPSSKPVPSARQAPGPATQAASSGPVAAAIPQMLEFQAEALSDAGKIVVSGGQAGPQPMESFQGSWSGGSQLFWRGGSPGAVLDLLLDVPASAEYAVELYMTRAPDYADLKIEFDGQPSSVTFLGYSPSVIGAVPVQVGRFKIQAGERRLSFLIAGHYQSSTDYFAGIDGVKLYPVGPP